MSDQLQKDMDWIRIEELESQLAAEKAKVEQLQKDLVAEKVRLARGEYGQICGFCGWETKPEGASWEELEAHILTCDKHPAAGLRKQVEQLQAEKAKMQSVMSKSSDRLCAMILCAGTMEAIIRTDVIKQLRDQSTSESTSAWLEQSHRNWLGEPVAYATKLSIKWLQEDGWTSVGTRVSAADGIPLYTIPKDKPDAIQSTKE